MLLFLRALSLIIILLSSIAMAISAERDAGSQRPNIDIILKTSQTNRPDSPWAAIRVLDWGSSEDETKIFRIQFTVRSDLPGEVQAKLRSWALTLDWNSFKQAGVFIEQIDELNKQKFFYFYGFEAKVPAWLSRRLRTAVFRTIPNMGIQGVLKPGEIVAVMDRDFETYPREIKPDWSIMDLLQQHIRPIWVGFGSEARIHRGSSLCADYLEEIARNRKAP